MQQDCSYYMSDCVLLGTGQSAEMVPTKVTACAACASLWDVCDLSVEFSICYSPLPLLVQAVFNVQESQEEFPAL